MTILYILACIVLGVLSVALAFRCFIDWRKKWPEKPRRKIFVYSFDEYERQDAKERIEAMGYEAVLSSNNMAGNVVAFTNPAFVAWLDCCNQKGMFKTYKQTFDNFYGDNGIVYITNLSELKEAGK